MMRRRIYVKKIKVFGHKSPDTDATTSAISMAYLLNQLNYEAEAMVLGELSDETTYALNNFDEPAPEMNITVDAAEYDVVLVDHNEFQQSIDNIKDQNILAVVDHHRIANIETSDPLYYRGEPVGCTNTILYKMYKENDIEIPENIAGLMLSAIVSDTLLFKSPTSTEEDEKIAHELAEIAGVDIEEYGLNMLKAGTSVGKLSEEEILEGDAKTYEFGDETLRIGQVNVVDIDDVMSRKDAFIQEMNRLSTDNGYDLYLLIITNILESSSHGLVVGSSEDKIEEAFGEEINNHELELSGIVSRKKQIIPPLTKIYES